MRAGTTPGDGTWMLLHGTPLTPEVWDGVRPLLGAIRPVLAPTLPRPIRAEGAQAEIADRIVGGLAEEAGPLHLVGHSFGGQVAIEVALRHPERVGSLTVLCSRASPFPAFAAAALAIRRGTPPDPDASVARWFLPVDADGPLVAYARRCVAEADPDGFAADLDAIAVYDRTAELGSIAVPTTILAAESDHVGTPDEMRVMAAAIPDARFALLAPASHMSPFLDPASLAAQIMGVPVEVALGPSGALAVGD